MKKYIIIFSCFFMLFAPLILAGMDIYEAAEKGRTDLISDYLKNGGDANAADRFGQTMLMRAAGKNNIDIVKLLIKSGANVSQKDNIGQTALLWCIHGLHGKEKAEMARLLLNAGHDVNAAVSNDGSTALMIEARRFIQPSDTETLKILLNAGADVNARNTGGMTALMFACLGTTDNAELLIGSGADVNAKDNDGRTAMTYSARYGRIDIMKLLLQAGAGVNDREIRGTKKTTLMTAIECGKIDAAAFLIQNGANINDTDTFGRTCLEIIIGAYHIELKDKKELIRLSGSEYGIFTAVTLNDTDEIAKYINNKGKTEKRNKDGDTLLRIAVKNNSLEAARLLMQSGADLNARFDNQVTILITAVDFSSPEMVKLLLDSKAEIDACDGDGRSALMHAASWNSGRTEIAKLLIDAGANVNLQDKNGNTALMECGNYEVSKLLFDAYADVSIVNKKGEIAANIFPRSTNWAYSNTIKEMLNSGGRIFQEINSGNGAAIPQFLSSGGSINCRDQYGYTLLMKAAGKGYNDTVKQLIQYNADVNAKDYINGETALMIALKNDKIDIAESLMAKASIDAVDVNGRSVLQRELKKAPVVKFLIKNNASLMQTPEHREFMKASLKEYKKTGGFFNKNITRRQIDNYPVEFLDNVKTKELYKVSPVLLQAVRECDAEIVKLIIDCGGVDRHSMDVALSLAIYELYNKAVTVENLKKNKSAGKKSTSTDEYVNNESDEYERIKGNRDVLVAAGAKPYRPKVRDMGN